MSFQKAARAMRAQLYVPNRPMTNPAQQLLSEDPLQERIDGELVECLVNPGARVLPAGALGLHQGQTRKLEVTRRHNPTQAYRLIDGFERIEVKHDGILWGYVYLGLILPRVWTTGPAVYQEPNEESARRVMIKKLFKPVVDMQLGLGSKENPYKEVMRMKHFARLHRQGRRGGGFRRAEPDYGLVQDAYENDRVLGCIDALCDERYLYIITPFCEGGSLKQHIPVRPTANASAEARARNMYMQMLDNIEYLHRRGICHRDVDPSNFLVRGDGRVLLADFAMSFRYTHGFMKPMGKIGKAPYCPPEAQSPADPFSALQCDIWGCTISLFHLFSGQPLYEKPVAKDSIFKYAIMARGLSPEYTNEEVVQAIEEAEEVDLVRLIQTSQTVLTLRPELLKLLSGVLALAPADRWTLARIRECDWMRMPL
mmetsp:Transcript_107402/g.160665  ORF Transcript_107402/g.160665 Transcript_107402/m.160665 type:complete len:426 (+) Transcript_107402:74-1351(+)